MDSLVRVPDSTAIFEFWKGGGLVNPVTEFARSMSQLSMD